MTSRAVREGLLAFAVGTALTLAMKAPVWQDPRTTVPADAGDPVLLSWTLAWVGHAATSAPWDVFDTNAFWPLPRTLAFSDALLGYAPFGVVGEGPAAALARYAVIYLLAYALAFTGVYVLTRQLGASKGAALVAGAAFAFSAFRLSQAGHLQILSSGGIPLALAMLARGHGIGLGSGGRGGSRGPTRPGWALGGWLTATWQLSLGFGLGLMFAYLLGALTALVAGIALARRARPSRRLLAADAAGLVLFVTAGALLALPYTQVVEEHPNARRDVRTVELYSPPASALVTAPEHSVLYGEATRARREAMTVPAEMTLLPGVGVVLLALLGLGARPWSPWRRAGLAAAVVLLVLLALGTRGPAGGRFTYLVLLEHFPGWQGVRTPGRLMTLACLGLALLAAPGVDLLRRLGRTRAASAAIAVALTGVVLLEGADRLPQATPRSVPSVALADLPEPVLVLPSDEVGDYAVMWWSTDRFPDVVNGGSAFVPQSLAELRTVTSAFPARAVVEVLREQGIATVVVERRRLPGSPWAGVLDTPPPPGVRVTSYGDVVVFDLR